MEASLSLNREIYEKYHSFQQHLERVRDNTPLKSPNGYYPYNTLAILPQILPLLSKHKIDLRKFVSGKTILDLGCGDGDLSFFLELFSPAQIMAVDWGPGNYNGMEACSVLKDALKSEVQFLETDIHTVDFDVFTQFDTAICFGFLYHSPHPQWILEKLARKSQHLFLTTKVFDNDESYVYFYDEAECNNDSTNWWCFTPKALGLMLKRAGFRVVFMERLDPYIGKSHPVDLKWDGRVFLYAQAAMGEQQGQEASLPSQLYLGPNDLSRAKGRRPDGIISYLRRYFRNMG